MSDSTRRGFLKSSGAVAAGVTVGAAAATTQSAQAAEPAPALPARANGALAAYVPDVRRDQITFLVEGHEVTVTDHELVARLASAMHSANRGAAKADPAPTTRSV